MRDNFEAMQIKVHEADLLLKVCPFCRGKVFVEPSYYANIKGLGKIHFSIRCLRKASCAVQPKLLYYNNLSSLVEDWNARNGGDLERFCLKLLEDLRVRITDRADSSLPEYESMAKKLGILK